MPEIPGPGSIDSGFHDAQRNIGTSWMHDTISTSAREEVMRKKDSAKAPAVIVPEPSPPPKFPELSDASKRTTDPTEGADQLASALRDKRLDGVPSDHQLNNTEEAARWIAEQRVEPVEEEREQQPETD